MKVSIFIWLVNTIRNTVGGITLASFNKKWRETDMSEGLDLFCSMFNSHKDAILDFMLKEQVLVPALLQFQQWLCFPQRDTPFCKSNSGNLFKLLIFENKKNQMVIGFNNFLYLCN